MPRVLHNFLDLHIEDQMVAELAVRRAQSRSRVMGLNVDTATRLANLSFQHPSLAPGILAAAAIGGLEPDDAGLKLIEKRSIQRDIDGRQQLQSGGRRPWQWGWNIGSQIWEKGIQGTSRVLTTALDAMYKEVVIGGGSFLAGIASGQDPATAARGSFGFSPGAIAAASALQGRRVNLGGGLTYDQSELTPELQEALDGVGGMPGLRDLTPDAANQMLALARSPEQQELGLPAWLYGELTRQSQAMRIGVSDTNPGRPFTPGRALADVAGAGARQFGVEILEPGSDAYNVLSGIGDVASNVFSDPGSKLLRLTGAFRAANRALVPDAVRPTVFERGAQEWLNSPHGRSVSQLFADTTDYGTIYGILKHSTSGRRVNARIAADLTDAISPSETARIMHEAVQTGNITRVPGGQTILGRALSNVTRVGVGSVTGTVAGPALARPRLGRLAGAGVVAGHAANGNVLGRLAMTLHSRALDPHNIDDAVENFGSFLRLAQFDRADVSRYMHDLSRVPQGGYDNAYQVVVGAMDQWNARLIEAGLAPEKVRPITHLFTEWAEARKYFQNLAGQPEYLPAGRVIYRNSGEIDVQPSAMLFSEMLDRSIPLPEPHQVRETMRQVRLAEWTNPRVASVLDSKPAEMLRATTMAAGWLMSQVWKPMVLFRVAYAVRILAEEQLRMAGAGLSSFTHHPAQYMGLLFGRKNLLVDDLATAVNEHRAAMTSGRTFQSLIGGPTDRRQIQPYEYLTYEKDKHPQHVSAWTGNLSSLWSDELASAVARSVYPLLDEVPPAGAVVGALEAGTPGLPRTTSAGANVPALPETPPNFTFTAPSILDDVKARFWDGDLSDWRRRLVNEEAREVYDTRAGADAYIEAIWARINRDTGGRYLVFAPARGGWVDDIGERHNFPTPPGSRDTYVVTRPGDPRLIEAIGSGRLDDIDLVNADDVTYGRIQTHLRNNYYDSAPEKSHGIRPPDRSLQDRYEGAIRSVFHALIGVETDTLSRSPTWRQFYWRRAGQLFALADQPTRTAMASRARAAGVPRREIGSWGQRAREVATDVRTAGQPVFDSMDQIDLMAKTFALEETQRLLYDLSRRRNIFEISRLLTPFGEAWNEIVTTWGRMMVEHPEVLRRASQGIQGARSTGIFYRDPDTDEEVFNYPGSEFLARWMVDDWEAPEGFGQLARTIVGRTGRALAGEGPDPTVTPQLTGRVQGLNLALGSVLPGFGPIVQMPAAQMDWLTNDPDYRWLHDAIFPFQQPDADTPGEVVESLLPTWFRRGLQALGRARGNDQRLFNNTVIDVQRAMLLSGEWKMETPQEYAASRATAEDRAKSLFLIRSLSSFAAPTGAQVRWDVESDVDGRLYAYQVLATEYRKLREEALGDDTKAFAEFVRRFGMDPLILAEPKSQQLIPRSVTEQGLDFYTENQELFEAFPYTAYFAMPDDPEAEFNYPAYLAQFRELMETGTPARVPLSPKQWIDQYNRAAGGMIYQRAKEAVGSSPNDAQRGWLRDIREGLRLVYPGFGGETVGLAQSATQDMMIAELENWSSDPLLSNTEAGQGVSLYMEARTSAIAEAAGRDVVGWDTADSTEDLRIWLQGVAQLLIMQFPEFGAVYDRVLASEVEDPETPVPTSLAGIDLTPEVE